MDRVVKEAKVFIGEELEYFSRPRSIAITPSKKQILLYAQDDNCKFGALMKHTLA